MKYSIGLQSGASDGAVSWGVMDRLLEEREVEIEAISGASSGSINTIVAATASRPADAIMRATCWSDSGASPASVSACPSRCNRRPRWCSATAASLFCRSSGRGPHSP